MTLGEFRKWAASLPDDIDIGGLIHAKSTFPSTAKRAALITYKSSATRMIVINPMGTHFPFENNEDYDLTSTTCGHNVDAEGKAIITKDSAL